MINLKKFMLALMAGLLSGTAIFAQDEEQTVSWKVSTKQIDQTTWELDFTGEIGSKYHVYDVANDFAPTEVEFASGEGWETSGGLFNLGNPTDKDGYKVYYGEIEFGQKIRVLSDSPVTIRGEVGWQACTDRLCAMRQYWEFSVTLGKEGVATSKAGDVHSTPISDPDSEETLISQDAKETGNSLWALIIQAILWGFAMLLTPCVFPMVPMTISYFMRQSSSPAQGRFKAFMYGLFIVLLYTVPISVIILLTWIIGGDAVSADIFNWLATNWLPNLIFFVVFMVFAASFFGAFEITMPSSLVNKSDKNSDKKGLGGIFFMALTLVLVSFSCTGPIVGTVLIKSTEGEFWTPMVTMLAFSVAFALPFTILALFPDLVKKLKSGSWLNSVKVVLGFIEVALGFKFLSVADQTYHWGLLDREIYLAIWIVVFTLLGLYLLGKIRFKNDDEPIEKLGVTRLVLVIIDFTFVVYMIPGMFGAPLKALSGYLPPMETQDFIVRNKAEGGLPQLSQEAAPAVNGAEMIDMAQGLKGYATIEDGLAAAKISGKPVFVDITGHGCVNCREMEEKVWSDPKVLQMLRDDFVLVSLYTDDKKKLPESQWLTTPSGKVLKDVGRKNSYIVRTRFNVNAQPNYAILSPEGKQLVPIRGYDLDIDAYAAFLQSGLDAAKAQN